MLTEIAWLDRDTAAQEQVTRLLSTFEEPRTLDSLGLGVIRDALADEIAPGVSTAQTRLRYFLFIPWIFERVAVESSRTPFQRRLRDAEVTLIDRLAHLGSRQGVIGLRSRVALRTMPSALYWSGLGAWEIRKFDGSVRQAAASVSSASRLWVHTDDDGNRLETGPRLWCELPPPPDGLLEHKECLDLSIAEAEWLVDRLRSAAVTRDSLLRHAADSADQARRSGEAAKVQAWTTPWAMPEDLPMHTLNDRNRIALRHARCVSEVTEGPRILYNIMLAEHASQSHAKGDNGARGTADEAESKREDWMALLNERAGLVSESKTAKRLTEWHRSLADPDPAEGFWAYLEHLRGRPASRHLQQFVHEMKTYLREGELELLAEHQLPLAGNSSIDGSGDFGIYRNIILPLTKPILSALAIFVFLGAFNAYLWPLVILNEEKKLTLPLIIARMANRFGGTDYQAVMAGSVLVSIPPLIVFLIFQKNFVRGIALTGLKG